MHDVAVLEILSPHDTVRVGQKVCPQAVIANLGRCGKTFGVRMKIGCVHWWWTFEELNPTGNGVDRNTLVVRR